MERKRKRIPYKKPEPVYITDTEYHEIISNLDWSSWKDRRDYFDQLMEQEQKYADWFLENKFHNKWGITKENLAVFKWYKELWYDKAIEKIDWAKVDKEKLVDIRALLERGIDPDDEFFSRWGFSNENKAILEFEIRSWNTSKESDSYSNSPNDGGFDDGDIIRKIQDGDGDKYGY